MTRWKHLGLTLMVGLSPLVAYGAQEVDNAPPAKRGFGLFLALVLTAAVVVASLWSSKRSHLD